MKTGPTKKSMTGALWPGVDIDRIHAIAEPTPLLTDWISCTTPPVREGVYEVDNQTGSGPWYAHWNGKEFGWRALSVDRAVENKDIPHNAPAALNYRGVRRWVLTVPYRGGTIYVSHVAQRGAGYFTDMLYVAPGTGTAGAKHLEARSFATEADAAAYAFNAEHLSRRHGNRLRGWKAVLA